jgi:chromosome segregation ATPase
MNILDYLDKESPEINHALSHGFRKGDTNAVGRTLLEEIKARKALVRQLADRMKTVEAVDRQAVDTSELETNINQQQESINQQQESINQQQELINLQQELIEQQQEESSNQQLKIGELEQDVADANNRIDALISGLTVLLQQLSQTNTTDL